VHDAIITACFNVMDFELTDEAERTVCHEGLTSQLLVATRVCYQTNLLRHSPRCRMHPERRSRTPAPPTKRIRMAYQNWEQTCEATTNNLWQRDPAVARREPQWTRNEPGSTITCTYNACIDASTELDRNRRSACARVSNEKKFTSFSRTMGLITSFFIAFSGIQKRSMIFLSLWRHSQREPLIQAVAGAIFSRS